MKIIAWSHNNEPGYQAEVKEFAKKYFSGHLLNFRNPQFFKAGEIERADVIICKAGDQDIIREYTLAKTNPKSGFDPQILTAINEAPGFQVPTPEEEKKQAAPAEDLESPDLGFVPKGQGQALQGSELSVAAEAGTLDLGSLSENLASVLGDLGEAPASPPEEQAPAEEPQEEAPKETGKKKKKKKSA